MSFIYDQAAKELFEGTLDLDSDTLKVLLVDSDTTADTERDKLTLSAFTDLSEADGANYARQTLSSVAVALDTGTHVVGLTADDTTFSTLGSNASGLQNQAAILFVDRGGDSSNLPIAYIDGGGFPYTPVGQTISITWDAAGLVKATLPVS